MGVAGTLALGINSASDGPVHTQAMSDEAVPGEASAAAEDLSLASSSQHDDLIPTAMATKSAAEPKLIDDHTDEVRSSRSAGESREAVKSQPVSASTSTANYGHEQTQQPTEVTPSAQESSSTSTPEPSTTPSGGEEQGGGQQGGGLVGGVVGGVGGLVGGLLGG